LVDKHGKCHFPDNILCAVNQEIANDEVIVSDSDEVAFYALHLLMRWHLLDLNTKLNPL
jgi:hypothetical protein